MRIVAGAWRGRPLVAPPGDATRPTADRVRQALFDMLWHAPWAGRAAIEGATVLDAFAGTGALGLEALSRGAAKGIFIERDRAALAALRHNIAACRAEEITEILPIDATRPPQARTRCGLVFLDPPYGKGLVAAAITTLERGGWFAPNALIIAETSRADPEPLAVPLLAQREHGAARICIWRHIQAP